MPTSADSISVSSIYYSSSLHSLSSCCLRWHSIRSLIRISHNISARSRWFRCCNRRWSVAAVRMVISDPISTQIARIVQRWTIQRSRRRKVAHATSCIPATTSNDTKCGHYTRWLWDTPNRDWFWSRGDCVEIVAETVSSLPRLSAAIIDWPRIHRSSRANWNGNEEIEVSLNWLK